MYQISQTVGDSIFAHAKEAYDDGKKESCGVVIRTPVGDEYRPCRNIANDPTKYFKIHPRDLKDAEDAGEIVAVVHSHPDQSAHASDADRHACSSSPLALPWLIIGMPDGVILQTQPIAGGLPLIGRTFFHGIVDCYTLIRDYYKQKLDIDLPNFERADNWWEESPEVSPSNLYRDNFEKAGFVEVGKASDMTPQKHDVILMKIKSNVENHAAIMDDAAKGIFLHHLHSRLSGHDIWGGYWLRHSTSILRHKSLIGANDE